MRKANNVVQLGAYHRLPKPAPRQVPLGGQTHTMLQMAMSAVSGLPLDTVRQIELFKHGLRASMIDLARDQGVGMPATIDMVQQICREFAEEMTP